MDEIQRAAQAQFDRQSDRYGPSHILADTSDVAEIVRQVKGRHALDVATGAGHTGLYLASIGWEVTLADISSAMLEKAKAAAAAASDNPGRSHCELRQRPAHYVG